MRDSHRDLIDAFLRCVVVDEGFAREVAEIAEQCEADGHHGVAAAMRTVSRNHRIRGMEGRARIAALNARHANGLNGKVTGT